MFLRAVLRKQPFAIGASIVTLGFEAWPGFRWRVQIPLHWLLAFCPALVAMVESIASEIWSNLELSSHKFTLLDSCCLFANLIEVFEGKKVLCVIIVHWRHSLSPEFLGLPNQTHFLGFILLFLYTPVMIHFRYSVPVAMHETECLLNLQCRPMTIRKVKLNCLPQN